MSVDMNREATPIYRIRFHGRGGQGMKTASRVLGSAFFREGFVVQDAPRYGAERRGAPIFAYVRASRGAVNERGIIHDPDLVIVADETLAMVSATEILHGATERTVLLIHSADRAESWKERLRFPGPLLTLSVGDGSGDPRRLRFAGVACAGAAARLTGVVSRSSLQSALQAELAYLGERLMAENIEAALAAYDRMAAREGIVRPGGEVAAVAWSRPAWVELPLEEAGLSAPAVHAPATSGLVRTGLWRTVRPVVDRELCRRCRLCGVYCPDGCIGVDREGYPVIDYGHCKGCLVCRAQCPVKAIRAIPEPGEQREGGAR